MEFTLIINNRDIFPVIHSPMDSSHDTPRHRCRRIFPELTRLTFELGQSEKCCMRVSVIAIKVLS